MLELTERANARLLRIKHLADESVALANFSVGRMASLRRQLNNNPPDASSIERELAKLQDNLSDHRLHSESLQQLLAQISGWHQTLKSPVVDYASRVKVKLKPGESISSAVGDLRRHIADLDAEIRIVRNAAPPPGEQKAACDLWLQNLPVNARPRIKAGRHGEFQAEFSDPASHTVRVPIASVLHWLFPDEFRARLHAEIDALPVPGLVLSAEEKAEKLSELRGLMLDAERQEAAWHEVAEEEGQRLVFRPFISVLALLNLDTKEKASQRAAA